MNKKLACASLILSGALTLTACGSSNTVTPGSNGSPASAASSAAPSATPTPTKALSGNFGDTITFPSGISVTVSAPQVVPAAQYAAGAVDGKIVVFVLTVKNGSKDSVNAAMSGFPKVSYGDTGTQAQNATDIQAGIGSSVLSTVLPGETQNTKLGYGIPASGFGSVRMEVRSPNFSDSDPAIFKGAVK